jgi:hypothetical protein
VCVWEGEAPAEPMHLAIVRLGGSLALPNTA